MPDMIRDGSGHGYLMKVGPDNRAYVVAKSRSVQNTVSVETHQAYQLIGTASLSAGTTVALHIKNNSTTKNLVVTYIRHQILDHSGGTAFPNASNYFRIALGRTYSAAGSAITPVNLYEGTGILADVTAYGSNPTLAGTANEIDRWYTKDEGDMNTFSKEGSVILPSNGTLELSYVGDHTSGTIYTRLSFLMDDIVNGN